jgi:hypothetical protein
VCYCCSSPLFASFVVDLPRYLLITVVVDIFVEETGTWKKVEAQETTYPLEIQLKRHWLQSQVHCLRLGEGDCTVYAKGQMGWIEFVGSTAKEAIAVKFKNCRQLLYEKKFVSPDS